MMYELISKKDLLDLTNISYGQLYRWKRKSIIPEEWFIKKSSYTGQETYFPKEKILDRIEKIKSLKDELSLDELAEFFSKNPSNLEVSKDEVEEVLGVTNVAIEIYKSIDRIEGYYNFDNLLIISIIDKVLKSGNVTLDEAKALGKILVKIKKIYNGYNIVLLRKFGVGFWLVSGGKEEIFFDNDIKVILKFSIDKISEEIRFKVEKIEI